MLVYCNTRIKVLLENVIDWELPDLVLSEVLAALHIQFVMKKVLFKKHLERLARVFGDALVLVLVFCDSDEKLEEL